MSLQADSSRIEPDITVVQLSGALTIDEIDELASWTRGLLDLGAKKLIFDLTGIGRIDSVGGATLVRCFFQARDSGSELRFAGAGANVLRLFENTSLISWLPFDGSVTAACEHLRGESKSE